MASEKQKLLVPVDGSQGSLDVVRYVAEMCSPMASEVTLFHVLSSIAESYWDVEASPAEALDGKPVSVMMASRREMMDAFMDGARQILHDAGFPAASVHVIVQPRQQGVARDILKQAGSGYAAVVAGKTGYNPITRLVIGSVASKLVTALTDNTLWLVGGRSNSRKVLVCIDGSPATTAVINHVGRMLAESSAEITLFHAIRNPLIDGADASDPAIAQAAASREMGVRKAMLPVFEKSIDSLKTSGIHDDQVTVKVVSGVATRGGTLFAQALQGGYGTIVVGRRGISRVKAFPIGRVPMKLVQLINDQTIWVVSG
ncbi:UspA domain-containing protein [Desulfosarcina cetonica]|uniref:universal stress protein n=1 Tax=Desulfosarcina cetonica TaxID=90730 RepID=UPI0006D09170|nr:universal stress protein [Desulfosarcina cetonica]VTR67855.1 UspA domain-containing protein [Desulfosarcina cetonica]